MNIPDGWTPPPYNQQKAQRLQDIIVSMGEYLSTENYVFGCTPFTFPERKLTCKGFFCEWDVIWWCPLSPWFYCDFHLPIQHKMYFFQTWKIIRNLSFLYEKNLLDKLCQQPL